eukprot:75966_1
MACMERCTLVDPINAAGYTLRDKITDTLQGGLWRALQRSTNKSVVIKVTQHYLHNNHICIVHGKKVKIQENIKKETKILKQLSRDKRCPASMVKYIDSFQSSDHYLLVMEDGGTSLLDFVSKAHHFIKRGLLSMTEWHKTCKCIFKQMMECVEFIHCNSVCHFDISLENVLINPVQITVNPDRSIQFCAGSIQIKLCDFGLAERFDTKTDFSSTKYCGKSKYQSPEITARKDFFCAQSNDMWCLGVCFFMILIGTSPWEQACEYDERFLCIMNGDIVRLLSNWKVLHYTSPCIIRLFKSFFKLEEKRVSMNALKRCEWINDLYE